MHKNTVFLTLFCGLFCSSIVDAATDPLIQRPVYVGLNGGFGSTTWRGLVPTWRNQNIALSVSTPIKVEEGGQVYGFFTGYEFTRYLALEMNYRHYPTAEVNFDEFSLYAFEHNDLTHLSTQTDTVSLMAKIMLTIPETTAQAYSSFGAGRILRKDNISRLIKISPAFGAGFTVDATPHVLVDLGFNYTAGYGESELSPSNHYIPFLYSCTLGIAYRI